MKICKLESCNKPSHTKGVCGMHNFRMERHGSYDKPKKKVFVKRKCELDGCNEDYYGKGYCNTHWASWKKTGKASNAFSKLHGKCYTPAYRSWSSMRTRCLNKNHEAYHNYGGRGITICKDWINSFVSFYNDMGDRPENKSLDRIDTDGDYNKSNCKWSTAKEQARNQRNNILFWYKKKKVCLAEFCEIEKKNYNTIHTKLRRGLSIQEATQCIEVSSCDKGVK